MKRLRLLPWVCLSVGAVGLYLLWPNLPPQWPVHWGLDGSPNGWIYRTPWSAGSPLLVATGIALALELLGQMLSHQRPAHPMTEAAAAALRQFNLEAFRLTAIGVTASATLLTLTAPFVPGALTLAGFLLLPVVLTVLLVLQRSLSVFEGLRKEGQLEGLEGWNGLSYRNPADKRLWVPKLSGLGYTLNFAHPLAWPVLLALLSPAALAMIAVGWAVARQ